MREVVEGAGMDDDGILARLRARIRQDRCNMKTCPHCGEKVHPFHLSLYSTTANYTCKACGKASESDRNRVVLIGAAGLILFVVTQTVLHLQGWALGGFVAGLTLAVLAMTYRCLSLRPVVVGGERRLGDQRRGHELGTRTRC